MELKANFSLNDFEKDVDKFISISKDKMIIALSYIGAEITNSAKSNTALQGGFKLSKNNKKQYIYPHDKNGFYDITANLRSSIGFVILDSKKTIEQSFEGEQEGVNKGLEQALTVANSYNGLVLVISAGMEYAVYVEARGYDVISNSIPLKSEVESLLKLFTGLN